MKTAISLSDSLYEKAQEMALYMGIPRSKLFAMALEEFIVKYNEKMITEKINEVYEKIDQKEFEPYLNAGLETIRNLTKNDTW
jgi:metal-responsive CopG/Arc/MetJ family transcriptional regulator